MRYLFETIFNRVKGPLERFFKTDIDYLGRSSTWTLAGNIVGMAVALVLSFVYARYLTKEFYGTYTYVQNLINIALIFTLPALGTSVPYAVARGAAGTLRYFTRIRFLLGFVGTIILLGMGIYFLGENNDPVAWALIIASFFIPLYATRGIFVTYWNAQKAFKKRVTYTTIVKIITGIGLTGMALLMYFWRPPLTIGIPLFILVYLTLLTTIEWVFSRRALKHISHDAPVEKDALTNGTHYAAMSFLPSLAYRLDIPILFAFLDPTAVAVYTFATTPVRQLRSILKSISGIIPPKIATKPLRDLAHTLPPKIFKSSLILIIPTLTYVLLAPWFFSILYPRYMESVIFTQIFALSIIVYPFIVFSQVLTSSNSIRLKYIENIVGAIIRIVLLYTLTSLYGILGAILALVISIYATALLHLVLFTFATYKLPISR